VFKLRIAGQYEPRRNQSLFARKKMPPNLVWDNMRELVKAVDDGCVVFDDTIIDKDFSHKIELVRRQLQW
jgi:hypothetical protein